MASTSSLPPKPDGGIVLAHLSDLHVLDLDGVPLRRLLANKRILGYTNLLTRRRGAHDAALARAAVRDVGDLPVDHVVITGDLTNLALEPEFEAARAIVEPLGDASKLTVIPGNHDIYTAGTERRRDFERFFRRWLDSDGGSAAGATFPVVKRIGPVLLAGLNSAFPTRSTASWGRVGRRQRERLAAMLAQPAHRGLVSVVAVHHNLHRRMGALKDLTTRLRDRAALAEVLFEAGVHVVLHGHYHPPYDGALVRGDQRVRIFGAGSTTWVRAPSPPGYNLYGFSPDGLAWWVRRVWNAAKGRFESQDPPVLYA